MNMDIFIEREAIACHGYKTVEKVRICSSLQILPDGFRKIERDRKQNILKLF